MNNFYKKKYQTNGGAAMIILVIFFTFLGLAISMGMTMPVVREFKISQDNLKSKQSYFTSESGMGDIIYRLKNHMSVESTNNLVLGESTAKTTVGDLVNGQKEITSLGNLDGDQRKIDVNLNTATGISFSYGVQVGEGGVTLSSGTINGDVYSNGPITGDSSSIITGTAISANSPSPTANISNGSGTPAYNMPFGNYYNGQPIAQSFKLHSPNQINKISLYIRKIKKPKNATVKIVKNIKYGSYNYDTLAQGTLSADKVTHSYGWIDVSFDTNPTLKANTTYWILIDPHSSKSNYYEIGVSNNNYPDGWGSTSYWDFFWNVLNPSDIDYYFNIYLGGNTGLIAGSSGSVWNPLHVGTISGDAEAHTVNYTNTTGNIYCQEGTGNNKACNTSKADPVFISFPISDANITDWENNASSGGTYNGNYDVGWAGATLGPKKINGDLYVSSGGTLILTGPLWVTGDVILHGGGTIKLDHSYGSNDEVIVSNGTISISGGGNATGSGTAGSYLMMLTTSSSSNAISISGGAGAVVLYAQNGTVKVSGGASLKEVTAYKLNISGNSSITYESGLVNNNFSSEPTGSWNINSWKETQ